MANFNHFINKHFNIALLFLVAGFLFGLFYSLNLLGFNIDSKVFTAPNLRSIHISLMLYGFVPLMLSYLPFLLIQKEIGSDTKGLAYLEIYSIIWYLFLVYMTIALLFGNHRGLAFYDFPYELNFLLALAGLFYILALFRFMGQYSVLPLWIKVSRVIVMLAPLALLILMNPKVGQVESTVSGPHGDNTLGISFALIPIYYLIIKYLSDTPFNSRWNALWIIPLAGYILSVVHRIFIGDLSYNQEWFFQYLTLLYIPLLYRWYKDADISKDSKKLLLISIIAFLFVDIEGNIIFIPEIRWAFHRNDLIVAHAHIAMGVGVFFMVISLFSKHIETAKNSIFKNLYLIGMVGILISLSLAGFIQADKFDGDVTTYWTIRSFCALFIIGAFIPFVTKLDIKQLNPPKLYHLVGFGSDFLGGLLLFLLADFLYPLIGFKFEGGYQYVVFAFMMGTGIIHFFGLIKPTIAYDLAEITFYIRAIVSAFFFSLYLSKQVDLIGLLVAGYDLMFGMVFLVYLFNHKSKNS
ncbi:MAG TPA: hypothetical protein EYH01_05675 [Campylobacterales bacterium]|nr:hypothetical protein [Campylobacterales bacterium]